MSSPPPSCPPRSAPRRRQPRPPHRPASTHRAPDSLRPTWPRWGRGGRRSNAPPSELDVQQICGLRSRTTLVDIALLLVRLYPSLSARGEPAAAVHRIRLITCPVRSSPTRPPS